MRRRFETSAGLLAAAALSVASSARAAEPPKADPPRDEKVWASCVEHVPTGATRPKVVEAFPSRGKSGYVAMLEVTVTHGLGETVLPQGFKLQTSSDAARALEKAGFVLPEPSGGAAPSSATEAGDALATTRLLIPFVPLPKEAGRTAMMLPPVPIAVSRASGELVTVCTASHPILVEDPNASEADPQVRANPPPRPQREDWALARHVTMALAAALVLALAFAWLFVRWSRRPKPAPVVVPKLPWLAALEELEAIRQSDLLAEAHHDEYFDRVSDTVRRYLGARYGFDGLETTTDEMRALLRRVRPGVPGIETISEFLAECDLVKFARVEPDEQGCLAALARGQEIVRRTTPPAVRQTRAPTPLRAEPA